MKVEPFYAYAKEGSADYIKTLQINKHWLGVRLFNEDIKNFILDATLAYEFGRENDDKISAYGFFLSLLKWILYDLSRSAL